MASKKFGTNVVGGLSAEVTGHLLQDHELQKSLNGSAEKAGQWSASKEELPQHTGTAISSGVVGRMGGADHLVWLDGNSLYDDDVSIGTVSTADGVADTKIVPLRGGFLILGSTSDRVMFYDESHLRDLGAWQGDLEENNTRSSVALYGDAGKVIIPGGAADVTSTDSGTTFDLDATAHGLIAGDRFYLTGMTGLDAMDDQVHTVESVTDDYIFVVATGSDGYQAWTSAGDIHKDACGVAGDYTYYMTCFVETKDGTVLESDLYPLWSISRMELELSRDPQPDVPPEPITLSLLGRVAINLYGHWKDVEQDFLFYINGTEGTDFYPGLRLYRTKSEGVDAYLIKEFAYDTLFDNAVAVGIATIAEDTTTTFNMDSNHGLSQGDRIYITDLNGLDEMNDRYYYVSSITDVDTFVINEDSSGYVVYDNDGSGTVTKCALQYDTLSDGTYFSVEGYYDTTHDTEVGGAYLYTQGARRNPPNAREAVVIGSRLLLNDKDNPRYLWFSNIDSVDHFGNLDYLVMPDTITGFGRVRNTAAVIMPSGISQVAFSGGLPDVRAADGVVGGVYGDAITSTKMGVLFARDDGVYLFDGINVSRVSNKGYIGDDLGTPVAIVEAGDTLLLHGTDASFTANMVGGEYIWHQVDLDDYNFISADSSGNMYGFGTTQIDKLFAGSYANGTLWSKIFGDYGTYSPTRLVVDIDGPGTIHARLIGNRTSEALRRNVSGTSSSRRIERLSLPRPRGEYFYIEMETTGDLAVHGFWLEVEK